MKEEIVELKHDISDSPLYSADLAPVPASGRTWSMWNLAFIWVGMAVCIPTYMLASYMIKSGLSWWMALLIIALANLVITIPMALNGHAGVKYGIPFPVLGRASFGTNGIHIPAVVRAVVACGWFGVQTWIGGLALYAIFNAVTGSEPSVGLDIGQFIGFGIFWFLNMFFVWKGTESIKWLEEYSAPILILMGILLIVWGMVQAGGFGVVLDQSKQLERPVAIFSVENGVGNLKVNPIEDKEGNIKAEEYAILFGKEDAPAWKPASQLATQLTLTDLPEAIQNGDAPIYVQLRAMDEAGKEMKSSLVQITAAGPAGSFGGKIWTYILWFSAMVGFWATMSISIADITRYTKSQKNQVRGQFIGLPGTMILYSFVGIFVTCAAVINFKDVLIASDAPWDPVSLLAKFDSPVVVIIAQIFMIIATLSTNIAANVIAPANAFSNILPQKISFKTGGTITGIVGILICPWWLMNEISGILIFVSGLLGPVLAILICDYFVIRKTQLDLPALYQTKGKYAYGETGFNPAALIALVGGVIVAIIGYWVPQLEFLYKLSWFSGFIVAFILYYVLMKKEIGSEKLA